ncbi:MAG TPA: multicopper oxidase domain-containing protein [Vicinamibacteria bacterium]|nr:multicopper oxidase domain-containing protein [Vicinamibacteria bacterium]
MVESGKRWLLHAGLALAVFGVAPAALAQQSSIRLQCPEDGWNNPGHQGDGRVVYGEDGDVDLPGVVCIHLAAGDGFVRMADGKTQYMFGFSRIPLSVSDPNEIMDLGTLAANFPAPTITVDEGDEVYLTLTNVGMVIRPDLFDPHSIHWHGFPQAAAVFDGVPESSIVISMGASFTYYYKANDPGTYMYHCHVEATEHMQMGMLGNLYVRPKQNQLPPIGGHSKFAYNDGDGSTWYDVEYPIQMTSFDPNFHDASFNVQPLPFADMNDKYWMLNGRGYPQTARQLPLPPPTEDPNGDPLDFEAKVSQSVTSRVSATAGQKILLRLSNLSVTDYGTIGTLGIPMKVVGRDARRLVGDDNVAQYYTTNSVTLGGGESADVILDTAGVAPGTYFLYTTNLHRLANADENFGGQMTEIVIN